LQNLRGIAKTYRKIDGKNGLSARTTMEELMEMQNLLCWCDGEEEILSPVLNKTKFIFKVFFKIKNK
jgi:hypothetical protein